MKIFFQIMLIFLFISCSGGSKAPVDDDSAAVVPDSSKDIPDEDFADDDETDTEHYDDSDTPGNDPDIEPKPDPCEGEPCKSIENSTGKCFSYGKNGYACECKSSYVWFSSEQRCLLVTNFYGTVCTGQTKCYDMKQEIECPKEGETFYGQDAQYAKAGKCIPRSYTIKQYDDGETVVDNNTGLEWQRKSSLEQHEYNWDQYAEKHCSSITPLGGYYDWKNPTDSELLSLVDIGYSNPAIDKTYFPDTLPEYFFTYISRQPSGHSSVTYYHFIDFKNGIAGNSQSTPRENTWFRCVRTAEKRLDHCRYRQVFSGDGYKIRNNVQHGLVLQEEPVSGKNWGDALYYCEHLTYAGISDWRLPNKNEVATLYSTSGLWSSSTVEGSPSSAWTNGQSVYSVIESKKSTMNVACVASNPCGEGHLWTGEKCASYAELFLKEDGCTCIDGFGKDDSGACVEQCTEDMCVDAELSTGKCETDNVMNESYCQCEEGYFHISSGCMTPCEKCEGLEGGDGTCVATSFYEYTCGCKHDYFNSNNQCLPVEDCNVSNRFPCINSSQKFMWAIPAQRRMKWEKAKKYCEDLDYLGYTNWRLPDIDELRTIVSLSDNVKTNGSCKVSEKGGCLSENCLENCRSTYYSDEELLLHHDFKWSSSVRSDLPEQAFVLFLVPVESILSADKMNDSGMVHCVRDME